MLLSKAIQGFTLAYRLNHAQATTDLYRKALNHLAQYLHDPPVEHITSTDLQRYIHYLRTEYIPPRVSASNRQGQPLSDWAVNNRIKAIRAFFAWAQQEAIVKRNPTRALAQIKIQRAQPVPFTEDEIRRLLHAAEYTQHASRRVRRPTWRRNTALIILLLDTGIRVGELCRLKIADVRLEAAELHIRPFGSGRKSRARTIPLGKTARRALWRYLSSIEDPDPADSLFDLTPKSVRNLLHRIGKAAGVPHTHPHRFRHTFAIEYLRAGGDIFTLQRILGHATLDMVRWYLHIVQTDLAAAHRRASPADRWRL